VIDARHYLVEEALRNGRAVTIRAVRPDDKTRIAKAFAGLQRESVYTRLFSSRSELGPAAFAWIDALDFTDRMMLVVTIPAGNDETVIGSGTYVLHDTGDGVRAAEVAFTVEEDYQGLGIAGRLLKHLVAIARANGIVRFDADVLSGNKPMLAVFDRCGLPMQRRSESGTVHVTLALTQAPSR
jgi:RimJ/RimL family protein N-acetyltransferase